MAPPRNPSSANGSGSPNSNRGFQRALFDLDPEEFSFQVSLSSTSTRILSLSLTHTHNIYRSISSFSEPCFNQKWICFDSPTSSILVSFEFSLKLFLSRFLWGRSGRNHSLFFDFNFCLNHFDMFRDVEAVWRSFFLLIFDSCGIVRCVCVCVQCVSRVKNRAAGGWKSTRYTQTRCTFCSFFFPPSPSPPSE